MKPNELLSLVVSIQFEGRAVGDFNSPISAPFEWAIFEFHIAVELLKIRGIKIPRNVTEIVAPSQIELSGAVLWTLLKGKFPTWKSEENRN